MVDRPRTDRTRRPSGRDAPERIPWLRYDRMARAVTERLRVRAVSGQPFWALAVRNPVHHTHYQVLLPEYPADDAQFCSCPDFARQGIGTCKHIEAATAWLRTHPEFRPPGGPRRGASGLWRAIEQARRATETSTLPSAVRLRVPGRLLFEERSPRVRVPKKKGEAGKGSVHPAAGSAV